MQQLLKENHYLHVIAPFIELPSTEIKVLSKALIARLIPTDIMIDNIAVLIIIQDDEVNHLVNVLTSKELCHSIPVITIMMDLSRSPHNMERFISKDTASILSNCMDSISEEYQAKAAQLIWRMMELNYEGNEDVCMIINNGSLQDQPSMEDGMIVFFE